MCAKTLVLTMSLAGFAVLGLCSCGPRDDDTSVATDAATPTVTKAVAPVASPPASPEWAYMIQGDVTAEIAGTTFDVLVMDYTKDGTDDPAQRYTAGEMASIKGDGSTRLAIAYLSLGEAEDYRYYFDPRWTDEGEDGQSDEDAPDWLKRTNPDWEGNYKVQYWSEDWQQIVLGYLDRIIAYDFDGVYLDIVDGFEYWSDEENGEDYSLTEAEAAARMIDFVKTIAAHARAEDEDFVIIPQNGERILEYDTNGDYLAVIDGIGVEDLYYDERTAIDPAVTEGRVVYLDKVAEAGKPVVVVDYVYEGIRDTMVDEFIAKASAAGYFPYAAYTDRELDRIVTFAGQGE
jgi:cysteinyl-tRNA synthetase, unknown class